MKEILTLIIFISNIFQVKNDSVLCNKQTDILKMKIKSK